MPGRGHRRRQRFARWIGRSRRWAAGADRVIELAGNVGFGRACNRGATEASGELLLVLNPDTEVRPGGGRSRGGLPAGSSGGGRRGGSSVPRGRDHQPVLLLPATVAPLRRAHCCRDWRRSSVGVRRSIARRWRDGTAAGDRIVDFVSGSFLLIRRPLFEALGGFDEQFFMYSEDADLCRAALQLGLAAAHVASVELVHEGGESDNVRSEKIVKVWRAWAQYYAKYWSPCHARWGVQLLDAGAPTRVVAHTLTGDRERKARWSTIWGARERWHVRPDPGATGAARGCACNACGWTGSGFVRGGGRVGRLRHADVPVVRRGRSRTDASRVGRAPTRRTRGVPRYGGSGGAASRMTGSPPTPIPWSRPLLVHRVSEIGPSPSPSVPCSVPSRPEASPCSRGPLVIEESQRV